MKNKASLLALVLGLLQFLTPFGASANAPQPPAGPVFNQVQLKVLVDNDFAVFMGNDQEVTRLFYQNDVSWPAQISNIQTLDVFPASGETFVYVLPMGGNSYIPPGDGEGGEENWSGVLNNIPLLDYPGAEVAVSRSVSDSNDIIHSGYLLFNNHLSAYTTSINAVANGDYSVNETDLPQASSNIIWSPAVRSFSPLIADPIFGCTVACNGNSFNPSIPSGAWDFPDGSAVLFRYPLSNANLPVSPGDRQVSVSWKDPGAGGAVDEYLIEYKETSQPDSAFKTFGTVSGTVRTSTVTGLTNGTAYTLRVSAINQAGSASSLGRSVVPTGTPSRPANQSYAAGDGSVSINFSPPENDGGMAVTNYAYSIDDGASWITRNPASIASPITITGLTNFTDYSVRLRAINPFGAGQGSLPIAVRPGVVSTRTLTYEAGTLAPVQGLPSGAVFEEGQSFIVGSGPTRTNFTFSGWKDGNVSYAIGSTYTVGRTNPNLTAQWVPNSLLGVTPGSRSKVLTWNIVAGQSIDVTVAGGASNSVRIQIPADALEAGTEVVFWRLLNDDLAKQRISNTKEYFVNLAVTWAIGDDINTPMFVRDAAAPILLTITNPTIVSGATAWQIVGEQARVVGTATRDGELILQFTEDPVITAANVPPIPEFSQPVAKADGFEVNITNFDATYGWESPAISAGTVTIGGTSGSVRTLIVTGLAQGQSATITQRSSLNNVFQSGTVTGNAVAAPSAPSAPSGNVRYSGPTVTALEVTCLPANSVGSARLVGNRLNTITGATVEGRAISISDASVDSLTLGLPGLPAGTYDIVYTSVHGTLIHQSSLKICATSPVAANPGGEVSPPAGPVIANPVFNGSKLVSGRFSNFLGDNGAIASADLRAITAFVAAHPGLKRVTCVGSTSGTPAVLSDRILAKLRAENACALIRRLAPGVQTTLAISTGRGSGQFYRAVSLFGK